MSEWVKKWPIEVFESKQAFETFQAEGDDKERVTNVTLAFNHDVMSQEAMDDYGLDIKMYDLENMLDFLENFEKRLFVEVANNLMVLPEELNVSYSSSRLPIKNEMAMATKLDIIFSTKGKPIFNRVDDNDIAAILSFLKGEIFVMTNRRKWEMEQYYNEDRHWQSVRYRRRLGFGVLPEEAQIVIED